MKDIILKNYEKFISEFNQFESTANLIDVFPNEYEEAIKHNNVILFKKIMSSKEFYFSTERTVVQIKN